MPKVVPIDRAKELKIQREMPDLIFLTKENEEKMRDIEKGLRKAAVKCPTCGFNSFGPHECPTVEPETNP